MRKRRLILNVLLVAGLWYANSALTKANLDPEEPCWYVCGPHIPSCDDQCSQGQGNFTTCGAVGYTCI